MKILCYVNHFFGQNPYFLGKSSLPVGTTQNAMMDKARVRKQYVEQAITQLKKIDNVEVKVCGINGYSLVPLDITFDKIKDKPLWMIYESLNHMADSIEEYDYFINIEDDILLPEQSLKNIIDFDRQSLDNEILLPNRLEKSINGSQYCVDLLAINTWTQQRTNFAGNELRVAASPHSAILILSRQKFKYALQHIDRNFRGSILYNELDSAFAYFHSPFCLYRSEDLNFHNVVHLDKWHYSPGESKHHKAWINIIKSLKFSDFVPPVISKLKAAIKP